MVFTGEVVVVGRRLDVNVVDEGLAGDDDVDSEASTDGRTVQVQSLRCIGISAAYLIQWQIYF